MSNNSSRKNGKKGGRPSSYNYVSTFIIPNSNWVILTEYQYNKLIERYGISLIQAALKILDEWLNCSQTGNKYKGKNNYAHFRSDGWLINEAMQSVRQQI